MTSPRGALEELLAPGSAPTAIAGFRWASVEAASGSAVGPTSRCSSQTGRCRTAAVFTRSLVKAAPVIVAAGRVKRGLAQAVLINAGCANAATGKPGMAAARESSAAVARALGIDAKLVLPMSTGVIGVLLPAEKIVAHAEQLAGRGARRRSRRVLARDDTTNFM